MLRQIEDILDAQIRPVLAVHQGNIAVDSLSGDVLRVRMLGGCNNCPSATFEVEQLVADAVKTALPRIKSVVLVTGVSDELLDTARMLLNKNKETK